MARLFSHECRSHNIIVACGKLTRIKRNGKRYCCRVNYVSIDRPSANNNIKWCHDKININNNNDTKESNMNTSSNTRTNDNEGDIIECNRCSRHAKYIVKYNELNNKM